jgi:restriction system protein
MRFAVTVTGKTGDGGVDLELFDSSPITGGRIVVQCKRYQPDNTVGVATVRELFGVVGSENAMKGVLVTTSTFTSGAREFADGKPLEPVDGYELNNLMGRYGV